MLQKKFFAPLLIILIIYLSISQTTQSDLPNGGCYHSKKQEHLKSQNLSKENIHKRILSQDDKIVKKNKQNQKFTDKGKPVIDRPNKVNKSRNLASTNWDELELIEIPAPIRITPDYSMADQSSLYFDQIKNGIDIAIEYFQQILYVYPELYNIKVEDNVEINNGYEGFCSYIEDLDNIPYSHVTTGIETDLIIYVKSVTEPSEDYVAYASSCQWHHDRPTVGYIVFNESYMPDSNDDMGFDGHVETVIHELFHVLGFSGPMISYFRTVDGKRIHPDYNSYLLTQEIRGLDTNLLASPYVKKYNREYFDCSSSKGAQLENQGEEGSIGSHWERLIFNNEMMNPSVIQSDAVTSIMTLAFLKDTNWYADVNFDLAEGMQWGKNQGCNFLTSCSSSYEEISYDSSACSFYRFSMGRAAIEYFGDDCPIIYGYDEYQCTDTSNTTPDQSDTYDVFSLNSKCFESSFKESGSTVSLNQRCYQYECNSSNNVVITITKNSVDYTVTCSSNGQTVNAPSGSGLTGTLKCPSDLSLFCDFPTPCEDYCSGKGYCSQQDGNNQCYCIDGYAGDKCQYSCSSGQYYENGSCVNSCSTNFYLDNVSNTCEPCSSTCSSGYCNENGCLDCPQGKYKNGSNCVSSCPTGKYPDASSGTCKECNSKCTNGCIRNSSNCLVVPFLYTDSDQLEKELNKNPTGIISDLDKKKDNDDDSSQNLSFKIFIFALFIFQILI